MNLYQGKGVLGIVRGRGRNNLFLEAITPGAPDGDAADAGAQTPPRRGDFLLLERNATEAVAVRVVEAHAGGPFAEGREAGATYLAELLKSGMQEVPDSVREMMSGVAEIRRGYLYGSGKPGLGIDINETIAAKYPIRFPEDGGPYSLDRAMDGSVVKP